MRITIAAALLAIATGCVPMGKYTELETTYNRTKSELEATLAERNASIAQLEADLAALEGTRRKLQGDLETATNALELANSAHARIKEDRGKLQGEVSRMEMALAELERRKAKTEARMKEYSDLVGRFQTMIDAGQLDVKIVNGRMVVAMASDILFASGSSTLRKDGKDAVAEVAGILASIPEREFQIEGHTDNTPVGVKAHQTKNWDLGSARAIGVVKHMIQTGMPPGRISAATYAEFRPVDTNRTDEGKAANRRIEIVVVPDLSQLPGFDELAGTAGEPPRTGTRP